MIKTIRLNDETYQKYQEMHPQNAALAIEAQLERFKDLSYKDRSLIFPPEIRRELEKLFEKPIEKPEEVVEWVKKLLLLKIGGIDIILTGSQRKNIEGAAKFQGQETRKYLELRLQGMIGREFGL